MGRACTPRLYCRQNLMRRWLLANELLHKTFQLFELWRGEGQRVCVTFSQEKMAVGNGQPKRKVNKSVATMACKYSRFQVASPIVEKQIQLASQNKTSKQ